MKRPVFVAVRASHGLQTNVASIRNRPELSSLPIRWTLGKDLHITLIPPWEEENVDEIKKKLNGFQGTTGEFRITFEKLAFGPNGEKPRLLWLKAMPSEKLRRLKEELEQLLKHKSKYKDWIIHMTLGKFEPEDFSLSWLNSLPPGLFVIQEEINSIALIESVPTEHDIPISSASSRATGQARFDILYEVKL